MSTHNTATMVSYFDKSSEIICTLGNKTWFRRNPTLSNDNKSEIKLHIEASCDIYIYGIMHKLWPRSRTHNESNTGVSAPRDHSNAPYC